MASDLHFAKRPNGVKTFTRTLAEGLASAGHDVMIMAPSQTSRSHIETEDNHKVARISSLPFLPLPDARICMNATAAAKKIVKQFKPDIIHIQSPLAIGYAARQEAKKHDIPVVATNHAMPENIYENLRALGPLLARSLTYVMKEYGTWFHSNSIDYITVPTKTTLKIYKDITGKLDIPTKAISCGINLARFHPAPRDPKLLSKYRIPADRPIVLYAGRLDAEKHLWVLISAFYRLRQTLPKVHLVLSGGGIDENNLKNQVAALDLADNVTFLGRVSEEELPKVYNLGDVFVMPSPAELQSIVTLEALASSLPIIAVDAGPLYELCHNGKNGYLVKVDRPEDMARKLVKVLGDSKAIEKMHTESLKIAQVHDINKTISAYEQVYHDAIKLHARHTSRTT